ncbi:LacI family DNA-binding transcriptional regulator [Rhizobium sp. TRM96647]|uniref:LacI family DNA-binding transcriptional regulator n=1 Tax=unclassified Rhizobium TaxID=2613769 RepID=UPI0021E993D9|nr:MULTISPECIES: LacI family DNA-binding transcriptional regulator [unclassified Rhizobium]MCV3736031.1 LacI family DNA-binding transcriptional regulator [Rhizobium sp. TRM96647]MCV3758307.1 LacI family DNA-binding transcriptional regulator [Rhizobium sp. TRM96650]
MRPTVHDIAAKAGVSLATVDRVLNGRPGVRAVTRARVEDAIEKLGYVRDVAAANLAKGRVYPLVFIIPEGENPFMRGLEAEVKLAATRSSFERTRIAAVHVPPFDAPALVQAIDAAVAEGVAGIAAVAVDAPEVAEAIGRARAAGVAFVTLVSDLAASVRDHFCGVDNVAAGRTAGSLMARFLGARPGAIAVLAGSMLVRDHRERLEGFAAVMAEAFGGRRVLDVLEGQDEPERARALVGACLAAHPELAGIYSLGAGNAGLVAALEAAGRGDVCVIAHEITEPTRRGLEHGIIDAVLNQDAGHEVRSAVRVLRAKADGLPVIAAQERIRIDIFIKENLPQPLDETGTAQAAEA